MCTHCTGKAADCRDNVGVALAHTGCAGHSCIIWQVGAAGWDPAAQQCCAEAIHRLHCQRPASGSRHMHRQQGMNTHVCCLNKPGGPPSRLQVAKTICETASPAPTSSLGRVAPATVLVRVPGMLHCPCTFRVLRRPPGAALDLRISPRWCCKGSMPGITDCRDRLWPVFSLLVCCGRSCMSKVGD